MRNSKNSDIDEKNLDEKKPVKIMLAEDDEDDQEMFLEALDGANIPSDVTTVSNGKQLVDQLKDEAEPKPDIIFMDLNMPVKGGKEALEEIKSDEKLKTIPAVILSTSNNPEDIEDTFKNGANLYVQKPNSLKSFILILKRVFSMRWSKILLTPIKRLFFISENNIKD